MDIERAKQVLIVPKLHNIIASLTEIRAIYQDDVGITESVDVVLEDVIILLKTIQGT